MNAVCLATIASIVLGVAGNLVYDEARSRLRWIPGIVLRIAARRLPSAHRQDYLDEWRGELESILTGTGRLPATGLWRGLRYAVGTLGAVESVRRSLAGPLRSRLSGC